jgi:bifunctional DNA-binding transcriptional regulator/antitoxin component of YhaV-PrlF toxin-antitoxin module
MNAIVKVTNEGQLDLPLEIRSKLKAGDEYRAIVKEDGIVLEKIFKSPVDVDAFLQKLEELEPDPSQPSLQEISEIVKEVRQELWSD